MNEETLEISCELVPENQRLEATEKFFDLWFPLVENAIYQVAENISPAGYAGGLWHYYYLSSPPWHSSGFLMVPETSGNTFKISCDNYWSGQLDAMEFGVVVAMYTYSRLSYSTNVAFGRKMADFYYQTRDYALTLPGVNLILAATD